MSTLSVPLSPALEEGVENLVARGIASNKAEIIRQALRKYLEEQAVQVVLRAMEEPSLKGDLDELAQKL